MAKFPRYRNVARFMSRVALGLIGAAAIADGTGCSSNPEPPGQATSSQGAPSPAPSEVSLSAAQVLNSTSAVLVCGQIPKGYDDGLSPTRSEWYVPHAMTRRLQLFPEFARQAGLDVVTSCAEARRFVAAYIAYRQLHPGFDANMPPDPLPVEYPPPPPDEELEPIPLAAKPVLPTGPEGIVPDILNGTPLGDAPVVQIVDYAANGGLCTGTYIAKNWVVTAAHCMDYPMGTTQNPTPTTPKYASYTFTNFNSSGNVLNTYTCPKVLEIIDGNYMGFNNPSVADNDFAVLYISPTCDNLLPVQTDGTPAIATMAVSLNALGQSNDDAWGVAAQGAVTSQLQVVNMSLFQQSNAPRPYPDMITVPNKFTATIPANNANGTPYTGPYFCHGDWAARSSAARRSWGGKGSHFLWK